MVMVSMRRADLHLHSDYSDGTFSPTEVVKRAKRLGLAAISLTDHDTLAGLPEAMEAAGPGLEVVPGVEMTALFRDREIHILGFGLRLDDPEFSDFLKQMHAYRLDRIRKMIGRLAAHGVTISFEEVNAAAGRGTIGRPHLAELIVKKGAAVSFQDAFQKYIGDQAPCFVKGATLTVPEAVRLLRAAGGVAVIAHPYRLIEDSWIPELIAAGIQGIEAYHSDHDPSVAERYRKMAEELHLLWTGGSDCHGDRKEKGPLIGTVSVPYEVVERLKAARVTDGF